MPSSMPTLHSFHHFLQSFLHHFLASLFMITHPFMNALSHFNQCCSTFHVIFFFLRDQIGVRSNQCRPCRRLLMLLVFPAISRPTTVIFSALCFSLPCSSNCVKNRLTDSIPPFTTLVGCCVNSVSSHNKCRSLMSHVIDLGSF